MHKIEGMKEGDSITALLAELAASRKAMADRAFVVMLVLAGVAVSVGVLCLLLGLAYVGDGRFTIYGDDYRKTIEFGTILVGPLLMLVGAFSSLVVSLFSIQQWRRSHEMRDQSEAFRALRDLVVLQPEKEGEIRERLASWLTSRGARAVSA